MKVGIDILDVVRMEKFVQNEHFLEKYFTEYEIAYVSRTRRTTQSLAGIYSAKEAFLKALGIGIGGGIALNEIEVRHEKTGKPYISVTSSKANIVLKSMGIESIEMNISHTDEVCTAVCILKTVDEK
ncbi:MAG: holo-[acyl-carrier-protein] synthase [Clostridiales bacterium]|nr:holo-[acyl-carrier-protein] synthase [Clostridiales bacterium]